MFSGQLFAILAGYKLQVTSTQIQAPTKVFEDTEKTLKQHQYDFETLRRSAGGKGLLTE